MDQRDSVTGSVMYEIVLQGEPGRIEWVLVEHSQTSAGAGVRMGEHRVATDEILDAPPA